MTRRVFCGVPIDYCTGGAATLNAQWNPDGKRNNKSGKVHSSHEQAFKCFCQHLLKLGFVRVGTRTFETPTGAIRVLDKPSRFGVSFRAGKEGDKSSSRFVPIRGRGGLSESP